MPRTRSWLLLDANEAPVAQVGGEVYDLFIAGIDADLTASIRCARSAGLLRDDLGAGGEGAVHHVLRRPE